MAESATLLVDEILPEQPIRQWVLSFPFQLRFLFASRPQLMGRVLGIVDVTPAKRGKGSPCAADVDRIPEQRHQALTWAQRLKRVFNIDVSVCPKCGGQTRVIASVEDQAVIDKTLNHIALRAKGALTPPTERLLATRASPDSDGFA